MRAESICIRELTPNDYESFHKVLDQVSRERRWLALLEAPPLDEVRRFSDSIAERGGFCLLACDQSEIVGWCMLERASKEGFRHSEILGMGLLAAYRGEGHGHALLKVLLARARELGISRIALEVFESNEPAIHLYSQFGFRREGLKLGARILDGEAENIVLMARVDT
jgi:ribosomal protein S18 acetylase RimI-like enzyme